MERPRRAPQATPPRPAPPKPPAPPAPRRPVRRRGFRFRLSYLIAPVILLGLIALGVLYSFYEQYAQLIDRGLQGDIFVRSSGIYAAPMIVQPGMAISSEELIAHLKSIGYQEQATRLSEKHGSYWVRGETIEFHPGSDSEIDGRRPFPSLRVSFGRGGKGITSVTALETREQVPRAEIEPELISTITNREREKRKIIEYGDLPEDLVRAILAIEDRQFFEHPGVNWRGIARALLRDYQSGSLREGGSSITQQLVKNFFLKPEKTWKRKLAEAYLSLILETRLSKEEILAMYCNQIYLGQRGGFSINGFGQAARTYFGKDIRSLSLHESALLAGIIRSPNYYSPYNQEERARDRRNLVLEKMVEVGYLTRARADQTRRLPIGVTGRSLGVNVSDAPYFVDYLIRQLDRQYVGDEPSLRSLRLYSTIDLQLQRAAYQSLTQNMAEVEDRMGDQWRETKGLQAALVAIHAQTGEILAMIGGRDYSTSQLNRAVDARRQPGSVFKPFVYAAALSLAESGVKDAITPATLFLDEPRTFESNGETYAPSNFGDWFEGRPLTVRDALVESKNVIAVEILERIGITQLQLLTDRAGLTGVPPYLSAALGAGEATPLQIAAAYTTFANEGKRVVPVGLRRVTTREGSTLFESTSETREVMSRPLAFLMTSMMQDVLARGTGVRVRQRGFTATAAGKTGSSRDAWIAAYTPHLVCVVWVGFDHHADIKMTGGAIAAPIWADFMSQALRFRPDLGGEFVVPEEGLVSYPIDPLTGQLATAETKGPRNEYFLMGTGPAGEEGQYLPDHSPDVDGLTGERGEGGRGAAEAPSGATPAASVASPQGAAPLQSGETTRRKREERSIPAPPGRPTPMTTAPAGSSGPSFLQRVARAFGLEGGRVEETAAAAGAVVGAVKGDKPSARATPRPARPTPEKKATATRPRRVADARPTPSPTPLTRRGTRSSRDRLVKIAGRTPAPSAAPSPALAGGSKGLPSREVGFRLSVCEKTGLLPVPGLCPTTTRRFQAGREP
ncbi:MAG: PBP1A family penicillin-binding protein, partial [Blastocatellia bacterium]